MQVSIDRCFIKGNQAAIAGAQESLQQARFPAVGDTEYVIIRQLNIAAQPAQLVLDYARQTEKAMAAKVNGWLPDALDADCVWFTSEADLYACLCRDIALGRASSLWFWQQFVRNLSGMPEQQIGHIWQQQRTHLAALLTGLYEKQALPLVWRQMGGSIRAQVLHQLVPTSLQNTLIQSIKVVQGKPSQTLSTEPLPSMLAILLDEISVDTAAGQTDLQLAVALYVLANRPHQAASQIAQAEIEKLVMLIRQQHSSLVERLMPEAEQPVADPATHTTAQGIGTDAISNMESQQAEKPSGQTNRAQARQASSALPQVVKEPAKAQTQPHLNSTKPAANEILAITEPAHADEVTEKEEQVGQISVDEWYVQQGGLFYLLNILNQAPIRKRLLNDPQAIAFPSGWGWLYRLGEVFGLAPERELIRCLARLSNLEEDAFLCDTPQLEAADDILGYAAQRYQGFAIWQPALLQKPAHISFVRPELDIRFKMQDLDIELRKSGLDINPGWVDWLGTMVRLHYRDFV